MVRHRFNKPDSMLPKFRDLSPEGFFFELVNSFRDLSFAKMVILEVTMTWAMNLALQTDVYCIIFQLLEVLSRLDACLFHAMDALLPCVVTGTEGQFIPQATVIL